MRTKGQFGHRELPSLRLSSSRGKGTAGLTAGLGRRGTGTELHGRASGLFWGKGWNGFRIAGVDLCLVPPLRWVVPRCGKWGRAHFVMVSRAAESNHQVKEAGEEGGEAFGGCMRTCRTFLGFRQWGNRADTTVQTLPSEARVEEESQTLQNPRVSEGSRGDLADTFGDGESSFQRAEGTSGKDLAPRWSSRVRTSLCDFHLELSPPSHRSHMTFLGEGKSQIGALHKNSLMENSQGKEPVNMGEGTHVPGWMQTPNQSILAAREIFTPWVPLCQLLIKRNTSRQGPWPWLLVTKKPGTHLYGGGGGGIIPSFLAGCFPSHPQPTARFPRFL